MKRFDRLWYRIQRDQLWYDFWMWWALIVKAPPQPPPPSTAEEFVYDPSADGDGECVDILQEIDDRLYDLRNEVRDFHDDFERREMDETLFGSHADNDLPWDDSPLEEIEYELSQAQAELDDLHAADY